MTPAILDWLRIIREKHVGLPQAILEVGSYNVNGTPRSVWPDVTDYVGIDQSAGPGVDQVMNAHDLAFDRTFELVINCESLEHDDNPFVTVQRMRSLTSRWLIITSPGNGFAEHRYPFDFFRFMPDCYEQIFLKGMTIVAKNLVKSNTWCYLARLPAVP